MNKNETRNSMKAKIQLMMSFAEATAKIKELIVNSFAESIDDGIFNLLDAIQVCEESNIDNIMSKIEDYLEEAKLMEGQPVAVPYVSCGDYIYSMEAGVQYPNGERLAAYVSESDSETFQAGSIFYATDNSPIDLTMAEIKKDELAEANNLPVDNKDIDLYLWTDAYTEEYTHNFRIKHTDILQALEDNQEEGEDNE